MPASRTSFRTFNQEIFEDEFALAAVEWTAAAKARHFALNRPCRIFKSDKLVLCGADRAMEQRCDRFGHDLHSEGQEEAMVEAKRPRTKSAQSGAA